jgi:transposase
MSNRCSPFSWSRERSSDGDEDDPAFVLTAWPGTRATAVPRSGATSRSGGIGAVILTKAGKAADPAFDRNAYRERNVVECLINRLKQWRRIATRYEKRAANYQAMLTTAAILLWR